MVKLHRIWLYIKFSDCVGSVCMLATHFDKYAVFSVAFTHAIAMSNKAGQNVKYKLSKMLVFKTTQGSSFYRPNLLNHFCWAHNMISLCAPDLNVHEFAWERFSFFPPSFISTWNLQGLLPYQSWTCSLNWYLKLIWTQQKTSPNFFPAVTTCHLGGCSFLLHETWIPLVQADTFQF